MAAPSFAPELAPVILNCTPKADYNDPTFQEKFVSTLVDGLRELNLAVRNGNILTFEDFVGTGEDGGVSILKFDGDKGKGGVLSRPASVQRALSVLEMEVEQINKKNYEHYMQKEIHEQSESLTTTMRGRLIRGSTCKAKTVLLGGLKDHLKTIRRSRGIVFIGCGTSYNAALAARPILEELSDKVREVLKLDQEMKDLAQLLIAEQSLLMFGRGYSYATALEGSLKVKEVALMHSEGILAGEMKHGPLALVDESLLVVAIATFDACFSKQSVIQQLHACKGRLIVMCSRGDAAAVSLGGACRVIEVPQGEDCLQPVVNIVPLQLSAYLTVLRGYNVDQPKNLAECDDRVEAY